MPANAGVEIQRCRVAGEVGVVGILINQVSVPKQCDVGKFNPPRITLIRCPRQLHWRVRINGAFLPAWLGVDT
jgi:hypothetical protein